MITNSDSFSVNYGPLGPLSEAFDNQLQTMNASVEKWQQREMSWAAQLRVHVKVILSRKFVFARNLLPPFDLDFPC